MHCPNCNAPIDEETVFCGNCGKQVAPLYARGATVAEATELIAPGEAWRGGSMQPGAPQPGNSLDGQFPDRQASFPGATAYGMGGANTPPEQMLAGGVRPPGSSRPSRPSGPSHPPYASGSARPSRSNRRSMTFLAIILALLVVGISAGIVTLVQNNKNAAAPKAPPTTAATVAPSTNGAAKPAGAGGSVAFSDSQSGQGDTDSVRITLTGMSIPPAGSQYQGWLVNIGSEQTLPLGTFVSQGSIFTLSFTDKGTNLLSQGDKVEVTLEKGQQQLPTGNVVLSTTFPQLAFVHVKHLLFSFPSTPQKVGLLVGLRSAAQALDAQALLLKNTTDNQQALQCEAQSLLYNIEGAHGPNVHQLAQACSGLHIAVKGDGFGMLGQDSNSGYVNLTAAHASLAATQTDSTPNIKLHAGHVEIAMSNVKGWLNTIDQDANDLLKNPGNTQSISEIVSLSDRVLNGIDLDNDESVDPVPGEAGVLTAYAHAQLMAGVTLAQ